MRKLLAEGRGMDTRVEVECDNEEMEIPPTQRVKVLLLFLSVSAGSTVLVTFKL